MKRQRPHSLSYAPGIKRVYSAAEPLTYDLGVRLLRNPCDYPHRRLGMLRPNNAVEVRVDSTDGRTLVRPIRGSPDVSATSDTRRLIMGLPDRFTPLSACSPVEAAAHSNRRPSPKLRSRTKDIWSFVDAGPHTPVEELAGVTMVSP